MTVRMLAALARLPITVFAIDEVHCISQWGSAFRPEHADLYQLRERLPGVPIAALTATADEVTREDIAEKLFGGEVEQFVLRFDRPNIALAVEMKRDWKQQLQSFIARHTTARAPSSTASRGRSRTSVGITITELGNGTKAILAASATLPPLGV